MGSACFYSLVASHHACFLIQQRSFNYIMILAYIISALFYPLVVAMADYLGEDYYRNQFSMVLEEPLIHLTVFLITFVSVLPRTVWVILEHVVWWPYFAKVKSA